MKNGKVKFPIVSISLIILLFGILLLLFIIWTPLKIKYYTYLYNSQDSDNKIYAVSGLIDLGPRGKKVLIRFFGDASAVELLTKCWNDANSSTNNSRTPLQEAVLMGNIELVKLFIAKGADVNAGSHTGDGYSGTYILPPLHLACSSGMYEIANILLENGANVDEQDIGLNTALHLAAEMNNIKIVKLLIQHNANKNIRNLNDRRPAELTTSKDIKRILSRK